MSNIIKYWGTKDGPSEKLIDSNPKADAFFAELLRLRELEEAKKRRLQAGEEEPQFRELDFTKSEPSPLLKKEAETHEKLSVKAKEIIDEAQETAERIVAQAIEDAKKKEKDILSMAREQGYQEGLKLAEAEIEEKKSELQAEKERLSAALHEEIEGLLPKFTDLVIKYVEKITGILADEYESVIYNVMALAIMNSDPSKTYRIHVPKEQYKYVLSKEDYIREVIGSHASFELISDSALSVNSCKIETENCVIDTGLDTRLLTLTNSLKLLKDSYQ